MSSLFLPIQIVLLLFLIFAFSRVYLRFTEGTVRTTTFIFWTIIWFIATIGVLFPQMTTVIANRLGIGRGADAVIYTSLLLLFYLVYRTNVYLENVKHEITELTRRIALSDHKKRKRVKRTKRGR